MEERRILSLKKDRVVSLKKEELGESVDYVSIGLKWGMIPRGRVTEKTVTNYTGNFFQRLFKTGPSVTVTETVGDDYEDVDLDSSVLIYGSSKNLLQKIYFNNLEDSTGQIVHHGDDRSGGKQDGEKDNETITLGKLDRLPESYRYMAVILNSYTHQKFKEIPYIKMRIYSGSGPGMKGRKVLAEFNLENSLESFKGHEEALVLGIFIRQGIGTTGEWKFKPIGQFTSERSILEMARGSVLEALNKL